jgi:ribosomal protein L40E
MAEIIVFRFLDLEDAGKLRSILDSNQITAFVKMVPDDRTTPLYHVFINEKDLNKAEPLIENFRRRIKKDIEINKRVCPQCKAKPPLTVEKTEMSFFHKLISMGTITMECRRCGNIWYV